MIPKQVGLLLLALLPVPVLAQKPNPKPAAKPKPVVFAVLDDGKVLEPIGYVEKGKLTAAVDNGSDSAVLGAFHRSYYKPASKYRLVFGGASAGTVSIVRSDPKSECAANAAEVTFASQKARLKGNVMALATNLPAGSKALGLRRLPTPAERSEIESLVRAELVSQKISTQASRNLKYHNLTALDVDADGVVEQVGTFWVDVSARSRALLFFIADKDASGKYRFGFTDFRVIEQKDVMSGEISSVDSGVYHERLLDILDIDNDGVAEVFTYIQSFEGAGFNAYKRTNGTWSMVFEGSNYHCGY